MWPFWVNFSLILVKFINKKKGERTQNNCPLYENLKKCSFYLCLSLSLSPVLSLLPQLILSRYSWNLYNFLLSGLIYDLYGKKCTTKKKCHRKMVERNVLKGDYGSTDTKFFISMKSCKNYIQFADFITISHTLQSLHSRLYLGGRSPARALVSFNPNNFWSGNCL